MKIEEIDFVIIGAAKSATTWLQWQLQDDPAVCMPDPELHFFSREYRRGFDWYLDQFPQDTEDRIVGERSNSYLDAPSAAERLYAALPRIKLVAMLRDPVERAYSDYCMLFRRGEVDHRIERHLDPLLAAGGRFLNGGLYAQHLQPFLDLYRAEQILITQFEDVRERPQVLVNQVRGHIGLEPRPLAEMGRRKVKDRNIEMIPLRTRNALRWLKPVVKPLRGTRLFGRVRSHLARPVDYPPLSPELAARMSDFFRPSQERLRSIGLNSPTARSAT